MGDWLNLTFVICRLRVLSGHFDILSVDLRVLSGHFDILYLDLRVSGHFDTIFSKMLLLPGQFFSNLSTCGMRKQLA